MHSLLRSTPWACARCRATRRPSRIGADDIVRPGLRRDAQAGATLSYTDNGDGTITDNNTRLMWEKKDDSGGIHDQDNGYTWG